MVFGIALNPVVRAIFVGDRSDAFQAAAVPVLDVFMPVGEYRNLQEGHIKLGLAGQSRHAAGFR